MNKELDIRPKNKGGQNHGYCEGYYSDGQLEWKGVCVNGNGYGYLDGYHEDGSIHESYIGYYFEGCRLSKDNADGDCYIWGTVAV